MSEAFRLVWTESALADLESILMYVAADRGLDSAIALDSRLNAAVLRLRALPLRCRIVPELRAEGLTIYRELVVAPYRVMFRIRKKRVVLLAVFDGRRDLQEFLFERVSATTLED